MPRSLPITRSFPAPNSVPASTAKMATEFTPIMGTALKGSGAEKAMNTVRQKVGGRVLDVDLDRPAVGRDTPYPRSGRMRSRSQVAGVAIPLRSRLRCAHADPPPTTFPDPVFVVLFVQLT